MSNHDWAAARANTTRQGQVGGWVGRQTGRFKLRLGCVMVVRDRGERHRYREIDRHKNKETELTIKIPSKHW
jgi:hypothetical protein